MGIMNGRELAQKMGFGQLYDASVENKKEEEMMQEQIKKQFNEQLNKLNNVKF